MLIDIEAIGVGGVDALIRSGAVAAYGFKEGHILGSEVAGTVTAAGDGVAASWVGRRVWAFTGLGGGYVARAIAPVEGYPPAPGEPVRSRRGDARELRGGGAISPRAWSLCSERIGAGARRGRQHRDHDGPARGAWWCQRGGGHDVVGRTRRAPAPARRDARTGPRHEGRRETLPRATTSSSTSSPARTCRRSSPSSTRTAAWWSWVRSRGLPARQTSA